MMTIEQQRVVVEEIANLENKLEMASMGHRVSMVVAEALREHFCMTLPEVNQIVAKFARAKKNTLRDELGLVCEKGVFRSVDEQTDMSDPELN